MMKESDDKETSQEVTSTGRYRIISKSYFSEIYMKCLNKLNIVTY